MTSTVTIYGASDDLVEIEGSIVGADEYSSDGHWVGVMEAPDGGTAYVYVDYRDNGTWTVALGQYEEEFNLPPWPATPFVDPARCAYSTALSIEVPDGTTIRPEIDAD